MIDPSSVSSSQQRTRVTGGPLLPPMVDPARRRWRRRGWVAGGVVLLGLAAIFGHREILAGMAGAFRVDDPAPGDAIVVFLGGFGHRPEHAARLFRRGIAPRVVLGTSDSAEGGAWDETRETVAVLTRLGVPRSRIDVLPGRVTSTRDEAARLADYVATRPVRRLIGVTTAFHTARARWIVRRALAGTGVDVRMAAAPHPLFDERDWYRSDEGLLTYMDEAFKTAYYRLFYRSTGPSRVIRK